MKSFPMFIRTTGRTVIIIGGGEQAAQKARLLLKTDATLRVLADTLNPELRALADAGRIVHDTAPLTPPALSGAALVFVATGCAGADVAAHALAKQAGGLVNVVDRPDLCDATTPSIVDRDPVVVAIGTEGTAPVLARRIKTQIETLLAPNIGGLAALAGRLRDTVAATVAPDNRRAFWAWVFSADPAQRYTQGDAPGAAVLIDRALAAGRAPTDTGGLISLVGAGPGASDLLTLRAVQRLQEADVIYYDRLVDPAVLELARRDAERVFVGKEVGANAWPQDRICRLIVAEAAKGRRVVRLKSGDPAIFGRAGEEIAAAEARGVAVEIVPGITAASGAAAALGRSLTDRGATDTVVLTTGTCRPGDPAPDWAHHARPGTTLAVYMGVRAAGRIAARLVAGGAPVDAAVDVVVEATTAAESKLRCDLGSLADCLARNAVTGSALVLVSWPKAAVGRRAVAA